MANFVYKPSMGAFGYRHRNVAEAPKGVLCENFGKGCLHLNPLRQGERFWSRKRFDRDLCYKCQRGTAEIQGLYGQEEYLALKTISK